MESKNKAIWITGFICLVVLVIALSALFLFKPFTNNSNTINVQGIGEMKATPDVISVYFSVETTGKNASEASDKNSKIYDLLVSSLIATGLNEKEITTDNYNVYEDFDWINGYQRSKGFKAVHSVKIVLNESQMNKISKIVDAGIDAGTSVSSINFELSQEKQNEYKAKAMELAAQDAKTKADALAKGFGKSVGKLVSVSINDFRYYPWNIYSANGATNDVAMAKEAAVNIRPSSQDISAVVNAVYKLN